MSLLSLALHRVRPTSTDIPLPQYQTSGSAGMDMYADITEPIVLNVGSILMIPTGIAIALPMGYEAQIRSRSGLSAKHGVFALNAPGTIDSDYRGEILVILSNAGSLPFTIHRGDRIAQMVIARYERIEWQEVPSLDSTERGAGGFGSTGVSLQ